MRIGRHRQTYTQQAGPPADATGAKPPVLRRRHARAVAALVGTVAVTGAVIVTIALTHRDQRAGTAPPGLIPVAEAPLAIPIADDSPAMGFRTVVFFLRDGQYPTFVEALTSWTYLQQPGTVSPPDVLVVLPHPPQGQHATPVGGDPDGTFARAYRIPMPADGGSRVGYAIVDTSNRIRYAAADPHIADDLRDIANLLDTVR